MKALRLCIAVFALCGNAALASQTYNLVQGIDKFDGSDSAWRLLETNGFVVADPSYKYIFEPYLDPSLPPFITIDSAWETYQVLLAAAPRQLESNEIPGAKFFAGIPPGATPSGLDFIEGAPEFASVPARRALSQFSDDSVERGVEALNYSWPGDSFAGRGLLLLSKLQVPPPVGAGALFQSDAWADELLWTQLGAWIEQSLPRRIRPQAFEGYQTPEESPKGGFVAPYPDFFAGLARLSRDTSQAMETAGMDEPSDSRAIAQKLLDCIFILQGGAGDSEGEITRQSTARIQFNQFAAATWNRIAPAAGIIHPPRRQMLADVEAVARRCVAAGVPSAADRAVLQSFFDERLTAPRLLHGFAATCDKLAELARKCADGIPLTGDDKKWISGYGMTLARFHFFPDNSPGAETNGPPVKRLAADSSGTSVPWAGLGKPEALYVILPDDGRLRLFRGAVLSYREGIGTEANTQRAPAPAFTGSFRAEKSASEILETLMSEAADVQDYRAIQENLETLQSRAVDAEFPRSSARCAKTDSESSGGPIPAGIAAAIARLNWARWQKELLALIDRDDGILAGTIASILLHRPEWLDAAFLSANFDNSTPRYRRVYTLLSEASRGRNRPAPRSCAPCTMTSPAVRWQAVVAVTHASWDSPQKVSPLLERLADTNEFVAAAAASAWEKPAMPPSRPFSSAISNSASPYPNCPAPWRNNARPFWISPWASSTARAIPSTPTICLAAPSCRGCAAPAWAWGSGATNSILSPL